ncbi:uncharacterized protein [Ambystoma mexicanum]|uniref:uncharacterized protein n=1 Tax=Ambystoma mexicanum TaxID=8296 RepID=UPI0037E763ED
MSRSPSGASVMTRSLLETSSRSRPGPGDSAKSPSPQGATSRSPSPQGATSRSPSPQGATSRSPSPQGATSRSRPGPGVSAGSQPAQTSSTRNTTHNEAGSRAQPSNRSPSPQGATSRSPSPQGATSRSPSPQAATSRSPSSQGATSRSPSPQGAISRSPSPQGASSRSQACPKTCDKSNSQISPPVPMNKSNGDVVRPSGRTTGVDVQPTTLSSPKPPDSLYGVQVSNLEKHFENLYLKSFLAKSFMLYGNVVCVTMHNADKYRYGLVFYKQKLERERALTAYVKGPLGKKLCVRSWNGAPPCIFGIVVTNIDNNAVDLPDRIKSELGIFGAITLVQVRGPTHQRFALVFYKYQEGQKSALASCNPLKTSFGEVRFSPWNKPPPTCKKMSNEVISRMNTGSPVVSNLRKECSQQPPASVRNWPPVAVQATTWNGPLVAVPPPVWDGQFVAVQATMWNGPPVALPAPVQATMWNGPPVALPAPVQATMWNGPPVALPAPVQATMWNGQPVALPAPVQATMWNGPPVALPPPMWDGQFVAIQPSRMSPCNKKDNENSQLLYSPLLESGSPHALRGHNRSRSPLFTKARTRTRRSRSRSPYSCMSKNTSPTRSRYSRCQSPHSNLSISTSSLTRARYSRSQSPCSYQLHSERWPTSEIRPLREHRRAGQGEVSSTLQNSSLILWINNLDETISRAELRSAFNPFGEIEHIEIKEGFRNNGKQAFLQYSSPSSVTRAIDHMDGTYFYNRKLQVDFAYPQQATNCLWVYGLQFADATEQYLTYVFKEFGHVQKMLHDPVKGAALVLYSDATSALNAINMKTIGGHSVRLGFANRRCQLGFCHSMESSGQDVGAFFRMLR